MPSKFPPDHSQSFVCEKCREPLIAEKAEVRCFICDSIYHYEKNAGTLSLVQTGGWVFEIAATVFSLLGIAGLFAKDSPSSLAWFCVLMGVSIHYWQGIRIGVLNLRPGKPGWVVFRAESPLLFRLAMVIEGGLVLVVLGVFLFSL